MKKDIFIFNRFKEYASFCLLENFKELSLDYLKFVAELKIPYLNLLSRLSEKELKIFFQERLRMFLESAINDNGHIEAYNIVRNWQEGKLAGISKYDLL